MSSSLHKLRLELDRKCAALRSERTPTALVIAMALAVYGVWLFHVQAAAGLAALLGAGPLAVELFARRRFAFTPATTILAFGAVYVLAPDQKPVVVGMYYVGIVALVMQRSFPAALLGAAGMFASYGMAAVVASPSLDHGFSRHDLLVNFVGFTITAVVTRVLAENERVARASSLALRRSLDEQRAIAERLEAVAKELQGRAAGGEHLAQIATGLAREVDPTRVAVLVVEEVAARFGSDAVVVCRVGTNDTLTPLAVHDPRFGIREALSAEIVTPVRLARLHAARSMQLVDEFLDGPAAIPPRLREAGIQSVVLVSSPVAGEETYILVLAKTDRRMYEPWEVDLLQALVRQVGATIDAREAYRAMETANRQREEFVALVAHEIRAPMEILKDALDMLAADYAELSAQDFNELLGSARRTCMRLDALAKNLLSAENIKSGRLAITPRPTPVTSIIKEASEAVAILLEGRSQRLEVDLPNRRAVVNADGRYIVQALVNLLINASTYGPRAEPIQIIVRSEVRGTTRVTVADRGPGIPPEEWASLYERFTRGRATGQFPGAGLGLSIVKGLVEAHGGTVGFATMPGEGSHFWFVLPGVETQ